MKDTYLGPGIETAVNLLRHGEVRVLTAFHFYAVRAPLLYELNSIYFGAWTDIHIYKTTLYVVHDCMSAHLISDSACFTMWVNRQLEEARHVCLRVYVSADHLYVFFQGLEAS